MSSDESEPWIDRWWPLLVITFGVFVAVAADATKSYFEGVYHYFLMP